jgi:D-proline reductase (dithiol) PrdB
VGGDSSYRVIPSKSSPNDVVQSHASIGFDHTGFYRDINLAFPLERLRELVDRGTLGSAASNYYSFMGAQRDPTPIIEDTAPEVARRLKEEKVDAVLLVPI